MATPSLVSQDVDDADLDSAVDTGIIMDVVTTDDGRLVVQL